MVLGCGFEALWAGLSNGAWLLCIGSHVCGSRGVAKMHCGRGLAMGHGFCVLGVWLYCSGGVALLHWGRGLEMRGLS